MTMIINYRQDEKKNRSSNNHYYCSLYWINECVKMIEENAMGTAALLFEFYWMHTRDIYLFMYDVFLM